MRVVVENSKQPVSTTKQYGDVVVNEKEDVAYILCDNKVLSSQWLLVDINSGYGRNLKAEELDQKIESGLYKYYSKKEWQFKLTRVSK